MTPGEEKVFKSGRNSCIELRSCPPGARECDLVLNEGLCRFYQVKRRSYWVRGGLTFNTIGVLIRRGKFGHRHTEGRRPYEDGDRDWSYTSISQGKSRTAATNRS